MSKPDSPLFFGAWLQRRLQSLDLTQVELAERAGCSVFALRKIEAGERRPSKQLAELLAAAVEIPAAERAAFVRAARAADLAALVLQQPASLFETRQRAGWLWDALADLLPPERLAAAHAWAAEQSLAAVIVCVLEANASD